MNKKFILIITVILIIIVGGIFYFLYKQQPLQNIPTTPPTITQLFENMSCKEMYDEIENDLDKANYCQTNSDCDTIMLGGAYIRFGCYHYINKNVDKEQIYQKMSIYDKKCSDMINRCSPAPTAQCVSNKCVKVQ